MLKTTKKENILKTEKNETLHTRKTCLELTQTTYQKPWKPEDSEIKTISCKGELKKCSPWKPALPEILTKVL